MNTKHESLIKECVSKFPDDLKDVFTEIAEYAVSLGYTPYWIKVKVGGKTVNGSSLSFRKNKVSRTLMRISPTKNPHKRDMPCLFLVFYASDDYSEIFKQGIKLVIEEFNGRYTGCYGCKKCKGKLQGYTYVYPDGRKVFRCGGEYIALPPISADNIWEIKQLMNKQDEYFLELVQRAN